MSRVAKGGHATVDQILEEAKKLQEELVANRRWLHAHPELGHHLPETTAFVKSKLDEIGVEYREICESGLVVLMGKKPGKCIILRADMDALPMKEESGLPFASLNDGAAHTCGHDMHTAMMLGVVKLLKAHEDEIDGTVKVVFQPAEEVLTGASTMIEAGLMEDPKVDAALTLHVSPSAPVPSGTIQVSLPGTAMASCDAFRITVTGRGCHGAWPEKGVDPITTTARILTALQNIQTRELLATDVMVLTYGSIHAGTSTNSIPDSVVVEGTMRTFSEEVRRFSLKRAEEIVASVAAAFRAEGKFEVMGGCAPLCVDPEFREDVFTYLHDMLGDRVIDKKNGPVMGAEDFSNVTSLCAGLQISLGLGIREGERIYPPHNPKAFFKEDSMYVGTAALTCVGLRWLKEHP